MNDAQTRNLACAIIMQAVKDYFDANGKPKKQKIILKELRSKWMDFITNGTSVIVAEQLELHPEEIRERLQKHREMEGDPI
jgi:hypothetical protein